MKKFVILLTLILSLTGCSENPIPTTTPLVATAKTDKTTIYMIKLNDDGKTKNSVKVGCGDSAIPVETTGTYAYDKTDPIASINAAFMALENTTENQFQAQSLENPIIGSSITIQSVEKSSDIYIVHLNGKLTFSGTCDVPRQRAQIEETIKKAALGNIFQIDFNGGGPTWDENFSSK